MSVSIDPGSTSATRTAQLHAQRVGEALERELRSVADHGERRRETAADRADEDDPPLGLAQQRQYRPRDGDLRDHVQLELRAYVFDRERFDRPRQDRPRVVD